MNALLQKNFISTKEASLLSGYNADYLSRLCREKRIAGSQIGRTWLIERASLESFMETQVDRKIEFAESLARERGLEYRKANSPSARITRATDNLEERMRVVAESVFGALSEVSMPREMSMFGGRAVAVALTALILAGSVTLAGSGVVSRTGEALLASAFDARSFVLSRASNIALDAQEKSKALVLASKEEVQKVDTTLAYALDERVETLPLVVSKNLAQEHPPVEVSNIAYGRAREIYSRYPAVLSSNEIATHVTHAVMHPGETLGAVAHGALRAYSTMGVYALNDIESVLALHLRMVESAGEGLFSAGVSIRDTTYRTPLAVGSVFVDGSETVMSLYEDGVYAYVENIAVVPETIVAAVYHIGNTSGAVLATGIQLVPVAYEEGVLAFAETSSSAAALIANGSYALGKGANEQVSGLTQAQDRFIGQGVASVRLALTGLTGRATQMAAAIGSGPSVASKQALQFAGDITLQIENTGGEILAASPLASIDFDRFIPGFLRNVTAVIAHAVGSAFHGVFGPLAGFFGASEEVGLAVIPGDTVFPGSSEGASSEGEGTEVAEGDTNNYNGPVTIIRNEYPTVNYGGVPQSYVDDRFDFLRRTLYNRIEDVSGDRTFNGDINNSTITESTINDSSFSNGVIENSDFIGGTIVGSALNVATTTITGSLTVDGDLSVSGSVSANSTSTNFYATNGTIENILGTNATITNATTTNFYAAVATIVDGFFTNLTATLANITTAVIANLTATNATLTNATSTNATSTNLFASNLTATNATSTNLFVTSARITTGIIDALTSPLANITTAIIANLTATNATFTNATTTNATSTGSLALTYVTPSRLLSVGAGGVVGSTNLSSWISGTLNQLTVTDNGIGGITLSLPSTIVIGSSQPTSIASNGATSTFGGGLQATFVEGMQYLAGPYVLATSTTATSAFSGNIAVGRNTTLGTTAADFLTVNSSISSNLIPSANNTYDIGSVGNNWNRIYVDEVVANNLSAASTSISGTVSESFTINSDNASADAEDSSLVFNRGSASPNALMTWNSATDRFEFNMPVFSADGIFTNLDTTNFTLGGSTFTSLLGNGLINSGGSLAVSTTSLASGFFEQGGNSFGVTAVLGTNDANDLQFETNGTTKMTILSGGNVGIGTASPVGKFAVSGSGSIFSTGTSGLSVVGGQALAVVANTITAASPVFTVHSNVGGTNAEKFRVEASGNVGINTATPQNFLHVNGGSSSVQVARLSNTGAGPQFLLEDTDQADASRPFYYLSSSAGDFTIGNSNRSGQATTNSAARLTINAAGNVGIGTTTPGYSLDIQGGTTPLRIARAGVSEIAFTHSSGDWTIAAADNIAIGSASRFRIMNTGNVGIGTTTPSARLSITGSGTGTTRAFAIADSSNIEKLTMLDNGRIGIGDTNPAYRFTLKSEGVSTFPFSVIATDGSYLAGIGESSGGAANFQLRNASAVTQTFLDASGGSSYILSGNVGIGTTTPQARLSLVAASGIGDSLIIASTTGSRLLTVNSQGSLIFSGSGQSYKQYSGADESGPAVFINRTIGSEATANEHGIIDATLFGRSTMAYNSYDSQAVLTGTNNYDHFAGFQNRGKMNSSGSLSDYYSFGSFPDISAGATTNVFGFYAANPSGAGAITNNYGVYVENQTRGTNNYAVYTAGSAQSYFGGNVGIGTTTPTSLLDLYKNTDGYAKITVRNPNTGTDALSGIDFLQDIGGTGSIYVTGNTFDGNADFGALPGYANSLWLDASFELSGGLKLVARNADIGFYAGSRSVQNVTISGTNGNLGVGSTTPFARLSVKGAGTGTGIAFQTTDSANVPGLSITDNGRLMMGTTTSTFPAFFVSSGSQTLVGQRDSSSTSLTSSVVSGAAVRNANTTNNNYSALQFLGVDTGGTGQTFGHIANVMTDHTTGSVDSDFAFVLRNNNALTEVMRVLGTGSVGIGTTTPTAQLAINSGVTEAIRISNITSGRGIFADNGSSNGMFSFTRQDAVTPGSLSISAFGGIGFTGNSNSYNNAVASAYQMYLSPAGNVGIGTVAPGALLDVSSSGDSTIRNSAANAGTAGANDLVLWQSFLTGVRANYMWSNTNYLFGLASNNGSALTTESGVLAATKLVMDNNGNVGIGSTNPLTKLHILSGTQNINNVQSSAVAVFEAANVASPYANVSIHTNTAAAVGVGGTLGLGGLYRTGTLDAVNYAVIRGAKENSANGDFGGYLSLSTYTNGGSLGERMRISSTGNVGIGTTSPSSLLHLAGSTGSALNTVLEPTGWSGLKHRFGVQYSGDTAVISNNALLSSATAGTLDNTAQTGSAIILGSSGTFNFVRASAGSGTRTFSSSLYMDTAGSVGIGTTNPASHKLVVVGGNANTLRIDNAGEQYTSADFYNNGSSKATTYYDNTASQFIMRTTTAADIGFDTNLTRRMTILSGGNVGIGTTNPSNKLTVAGNIELVTGANRFIQIGSATNYYYNLQSTGDDFQIIEGGDPLKVRLHIDYPNGNVGIGTTAPFGKFQIGTPTGANTNILSNEANIFGAYNINGPTLGLFTTNASTVGIGGSIGFGGEGGQASSPYIFGRIMGAKEAGGTYNGYLAFFTTPTGSQTDSERMRIDSTGNVGIGTTSPAGKLDVTAGLGVYSYIGGASTGHRSVRLGADSSGYATIQGTGRGSQIASAFDLTLQPEGGNVGIGNTSPSNLLTVGVTGSSANTLPTLRIQGQSVSDGVSAYGSYGSFILNSINAYTGSARRFMVTNALNANTFAIIRSTDATTDPALGTGGAITSGTADFAISYTGNVGIGTTTPLSKLQVSTSGADAFSLDLLTGSSHDTGLRIGRGSGVNGAGIQMVTAATDYLSFYVNGSALPTINTAAQMVLTEGGNVGIGTTAPGDKLHVYDATGTVGNPTIRLESLVGGYGAGVEAGSVLTGGSYLAMGKAVWDGEGSWNTTASTQDSYFTVHTAENGTLAEKLRITSAGNVGIGTTNPVYKLHVQGDGMILRNAGRIDSDIVDTAIGSNNGYWSWSLNGALGANTYGLLTRSDAGSFGAEALRFTRSGTSINSVAFLSGNVSIGTATPGDKFTVEVAANKRINVGVVSSSVIADFSTGATGIQFSRPNDGADSLNSIFTYNDASSDTNFALAARNDLVFAAGGGASYQNSPERMRIEANGNVGIGTTNPATKLDVSGANSAIQITGSNISSLQFQSPGSYANINTYNDGTLRFHSSASSFNSASTQLVLTSSGNVGIGTASPSVRLDVRAPASAASMTLGSATGVALGVQSAGGSYGWYSGVNNATGDSWIQAGRTDGSTSVYNLSLQASGGWVGIGIASPSARLQVAGSGSSQLLLDYLGAGDNYIDATGSTVFRTNGYTSRMSINSAGVTVHGLVSCGGIQTNGSGTMSCTSDERLKDVQDEFTTGLAGLRGINPQTYTWKNGTDYYDGGIAYSGFIAQNVGANIPEAMGEGANGFKQINTTTILAASVNAIKELDIRTLALAPAAENAEAHSLAVSADASVAGMLTVTGTGTFNDALTAASILSNGSVTATSFLTETSDSLPNEVLTGGEADLYKMANYAITGMQALAARTDLILEQLDTIEGRLAALELSQSAEPGFLGISPDMFKSLLAGVGIAFEEGITSIEKLVAERLTVGSVEKPTGITLYDEETGEPYCLSIGGGSQNITPGECQIATPTTPDVTPTPVPQPPAPVVVDEEPPTPPEGEEGGLEPVFPTPGQTNPDPEEPPAAPEPVVEEPPVAPEVVTEPPPAPISSAPGAPTL